jgi:hypothetical protein
VKAVRFQVQTMGLVVAVIAVLFTTVGKTMTRWASRSADLAPLSKTDRAMRVLLLPNGAVRLRLRSLTILIALMAVAVSSKMHHDKCMERARFYGSRADLYRTHADIWHSWARGIDVWDQWGVELLPTDGGIVEPARNEFRALAGRCERLQAEFERAAWLPSGPMPAEIRREEFTAPTGIW